MNDDQGDQVQENETPKANEVQTESRSRPFPQVQPQPVANTTTTKSGQQIRLADLPDLLTVREVADLLRVSPLTIKRWGKRGKLPAIRINSRGDRRYKKEAVLWLLGMQVEN